MLCAREIFCSEVCWHFPARCVKSVCRSHSTKLMIKITLTGNWIFQWIFNLRWNRDELDHELWPMSWFTRSNGSIWYDFNLANTNIGAFIRDDNHRSGGKGRPLRKIYLQLMSFTSWISTTKLWCELDSPKKPNASSFCLPWALFFFSLFSQTDCFSLASSPIPKSSNRPQSICANVFAN